jgi:hypothetical protein
MVVHLFVLGLKLCGSLLGPLSSIGAEQVIAGFHGPSEADRRDELIDRAALRISHRPLESIPGKSRSSSYSDLCVY